MDRPGFNAATIPTARHQRNSYEVKLARVAVQFLEGAEQCLLASRFCCFLVHR